jgi:hypothetical protein
VADIQFSVVVTPGTETVPWLLYINYIGLFLIWHSNGFNSGEFEGHFVDLTDSSETSSVTFRRII